MKTVCVLLAPLIILQTGCRTVGGHGYRDRCFGKKIAASYLVEFSEQANGGEPLVGEAIVTFGADGTFAGEETLDFGADHPPRFKSGKRGTWAQTGPRELTLTFLAFDYGQEQDNPVSVLGPENRVTGTVRVLSTVLFDEGFQAFSWECTVEVFLAIDGADPLDPNAMPSIGPFSATATGRRISAPFSTGNLPSG
jgi:hypothetical protein